MASRCAVAASSDWPPDRKGDTGHAPGAAGLEHFTVFPRLLDRGLLRALLPEIAMLGLSNHALERDLLINRAANTVLNVHSLTA